eukprot:PhF_6_TR13012/c0_g1_i2/m.20620
MGRLRTLLLFSQTLFLLSVLGAMHHLHCCMEKKFKTLEAISDWSTIGTTNDDAMAQPPQYQKAIKLHPVLREAILRGASEFFLGDVNGGIANFLSNIFSYNFGFFGFQVNQFAQTVNSVVTKKPAPSQCFLPKPCTSAGRLECPDGHHEYCSTDHSIVNCAPAACTAPYIAMGSSLTSSVANVVAQLSPVYNPSPNRPAAFSDGVFRLDRLLDWVRNQANYPAWQNSASLCSRLSDAIGGMYWSGTFRHRDGTYRSWDVNQQVQQVLSYVGQVCY